MDPFLIALMLRGLPKASAQEPKLVAPAPLSSATLAKEWTKAEIARRATLTKVVEVNALDEAQAQLELSLRLKVLLQKEWHFNDSTAHRDFRSFMKDPQRDAGQLPGN